MGGFECADHINRAGDRVNLLQLTEHDIRAREDYAPAGKAFDPYGAGRDLLVCGGILALRIRLHGSGNPHDGGSPSGHPGYLGPVSLRVSGRPHAPPTPASWIASWRSAAPSPVFTGSRPTNRSSWSRSMRSVSCPGIPETCGVLSLSQQIRAGDIKWHLCRAAIAGIQALLDTDPACRILTIEPLIRVHPSEHSSPAHLANLNNNQFQAMDIIAGRMCPETRRARAVPRYTRISIATTTDSGPTGRAISPGRNPKRAVFPYRTCCKALTSGTDAHSFCRKPVTSVTGGRDGCTKPCTNAPSSFVRTGTSWASVSIRSLTGPTGMTSRYSTTAGSSTWIVIITGFPTVRRSRRLHQMQEVVTNSVLQPASSYWPTEGPEN